MRILAFKFQCDAIDHRWYYFCVNCGHSILQKDCSFARRSGKEFVFAILILNFLPLGLNTFWWLDFQSFTKRQFQFCNSKPIFCLRESYRLSDNSKLLFRVLIILSESCILRSFLLFQVFLPWLCCFCKKSFHKWWLCFE